MKKFNRFISLPISLTHFFAVLVVLLFLCSEYKNPFDPKYEGNYDFSISGLKGPIHLSIFEPLTFEMKDNSAVDTFQTYSCVVKDSNVARVEPVKGNKRKFNVFFYKPCQTLLYVNGIRPNEKIVSKEYTVNVGNPYKILGDSILAKNKIGTFRINRMDKDSLIKSIQWRFGNSDSIKLKDSTFSVYWNENGKDSVIEAELRSDDSTKYILRDTIIFAGWAPKIEKISIKNADTTKQMNQVDSFTVNITVNDSDLSYPLIISLFLHDSLLKSVSINAQMSECGVRLSPINKPGAGSLKIIVVDTMQLKDSCSVPITVNKVIPRVNCKQVDTIALNDTSDFRIESSVNSTSFKWVLSKNDTVIYRDSSISMQWKIPPLTLEGTYILKITPVNKNNGDSVMVALCTLMVKKFTYKAMFKDQKDTLKIKVNRPCTLHVAMMKDNHTISNNGIKYTWTLLPAGNASKYIEKYDTCAILDFKDSVPQFSIQVSGIVENEVSTVAQISVTTRKYNPQFQFVKRTYETPVNSTLKLDYKAIPTDPDSTSINAYYYWLSGTQDSVGLKLDNSGSIFFGKIGVCTVKMWCFDRDGARSNTDSATVTVSADLPYIFVNNTGTQKFAINKPIVISGVSVHPGKAGIRVDSILWKKDSNSSVYNAVKASDSVLIEKNGYPEPVSFTVTLICKDDSGVTSAPVTKYINVYSDIPKIDIFARSDSSKAYKGLPVKFNIAITDPDDSAWTFKIFGNDVLLDSEKVKQTDSFSMVFNKAGKYAIKATATDSLHTSEKFTLADTLVVDPGIPIVNNIKIQDTLLYINDTVKCSVSAIDHNGKIKKFLYYKNDTLSQAIEKSDSSMFVCTFADSGLKKIFVRVVDDDGLNSEFKDVSFTVRKGQPVVQSVATNVDNCFVNDSIKFTMTFFDSNGTITKNKIAWNGDTSVFESKSFTPRDTEKTVIDSLWHKFTVADTGWKTIKIQVQDDDSLYSEWKEKKIYVKKGIPRIDSVKIKPSTTLFIKDSVTLTVYPYDTNNTITTVAVSWKNNGTFENLTKLTNGSFEIKRYLLKSDTIFTQILIRATDTTNFIKDSLSNLTVLPGHPVITDVSPDTIWALKDTTFKIDAIDPDTRDVITKRSFDWDNNGTWDYTTTTDSASHKWDTLQGNDYPGIFKVMVEDNDTMTTAKICTVFVKIGRPVLSLANFGDSIQWVKGAGSARDTMFYKWKSGDSYVIISATDPNSGSIVRYDWDRGNDGNVDYPNTNSNILNKYFSPNLAELLSVRVRDNDSLWSNKLVFNVFPDGPPPAPNSYTSTTDGDSIVLRWERTFDVKDQDSTQVQLYVAYKNAPADNPTPTTALFTSVLPKVASFRTYTSGGGTVYNYYKFVPDAANRGKDGKWKVVLKDARGSETNSAVYDFTAP